MQPLPPLSLYIHVPWCVRKCPYCDFNSHAATDTLPESQYVDALLADLALDTAAAHGRPLQSIFFGGGTPSLFSAQSIERILVGAQSQIGFAEDIEITLEANPGTTEQERFRAYRAAGVNRLSLGIQSLNENHLKTLGRIHDRHQAIASTEQARRAGFDNFNIDLMHGLPDQTPGEAYADLQAALALAPTHLSWYQLTIEANTEFFKRPPLLPEDDTLAVIQDAGTELLAAAGFRQYEVSAYAHSGRRARHNCNYWAFGDYIGIGAGAHGKLTATDGTIVRTRKTRLPKDYLASASQWILGSKNDRLKTPITNADLPFEFMLNALRLVDGVPATMFSERTGLSLSTIEPVLARLRQQQLLQQTSETIAATPDGLRFLNSVIAEFLP